MGKSEKNLQLPKHNMFPSPRHVSPSARRGQDEAPLPRADARAEGLASERAGNCRYDNRTQGTPGPGGCARIAEEPGLLRRRQGAGPNRPGGFRGGAPRRKRGCGRESHSEGPAPGGRGQSRAQSRQVPFPAAQGSGGVPAVGAAPRGVCRLPVPTTRVRPERLRAPSGALRAGPPREREPPRPEPSGVTGAVRRRGRASGRDPSGRAAHRPGPRGCCRGAAPGDVARSAWHARLLPGPAQWPYHVCALGPLSKYGKRAITRHARHHAGEHEAARVRTPGAAVRPASAQGGLERGACSEQRLAEDKRRWARPRCDPGGASPSRRGRARGQHVAAADASQGQSLS